MSSWAAFAVGGFVFCIVSAIFIRCFEGGDDDSKNLKQD